MSPPQSVSRRRRGVLALGTSLLLGAGGVAVVTLGAGAGGTADAAPGASEVTPRTDDSIPSQQVIMFGSSPAEAPDETWGIGSSLGTTSVVRYTDAGWTLAPPLQDAGGSPLPGFELAHPEAGRLASPSPLAGQMTAGGDGAMLGKVPASGAAPAREVLLSREPGGAFREVPSPPAKAEAEPGEVSLEPGETLFGVNQSPMVAALDEGGHAGAFVVPVDEHGDGIEGSVLHWDGHEWTREQIEVPAASQTEFTVIAISASAPDHAWLLARLSNSYPAGSIGLFKRRPAAEGEPAVWQPVAPAAGAGPGEPLTVPTTSVTPAPLTVVTGTQSQVLTATSEGVWIDGERSDSRASATAFFRPEGADGGRVVQAWCAAPSSGSSGIQPCPEELPQTLPTTGGRSFAWANPGASNGLGERVLTGLPAGASLRLEGEQFTVIAALGGSPRQDVGGSYGAAFSSPREGWLGQASLPVHMTLKSLPSQIAPWPVPFRKALLALAPQPGVAVGALSSQVLAVGDQGEVARFKPGSGWTPESLLGTGGKPETPRLRGVAWPTPQRAYAVGDEGAMWRWRGETGLWEADPAAPVNFRGNLLGVAFDPANSARGYAVGTSGVLLHYGKSWEQDTMPSQGPCTPRSEANPEEAERCSNWSNANFTSIAFAGSEAIVAYRVLLSTSSQVYRGGLLVNSGSGWHVDEGAAAALGESAPYAVAALPDGGAAFGATTPVGQAQIFERQSTGTPWHTTPTPFPGRAPGSLAVFREGSALRVIASGAVPDTAQLESKLPPPAGQPPNLLPPYPVETRPEQGVLRETATGWSDEQHELNNTREPPGEYANYDTVYQPDPVIAVLVDGSGANGWAVGGFVSEHVQLDTSEVARYPKDESPPLGEGTSTIAPGAASNAVFAIGGNAQCEAACALSRNARIGPDVWLESALAHAVGKPGSPGVSEGIRGVRDFIYTGSRVTTGRRAGPATVPVPYQEELGRYAELLRGYDHPVLPVPSATDLDGAESEQTFQQQMAGLLSPVNSVFHEQCNGSAGCAGSYYAFSSPASGSSPAVRVIVLDERQPVGGAQLGWLKAELEQASAIEPAIVIGNANLAALDGQHTEWAQRVTQVLAAGQASAYFFDSPEENVKLELQSGSGTVPSFGSGTLGYVSYLSEKREDFHGASGYLLTEVGAPFKGKQAHVTVRLIPNVGELALEGVDGTLLRRSSAALFQGLARRPRAGNRANNGAVTGDTDPYVPIPEQCFGPSCPNDLFPEYTFTSSNETVGVFVKPVPGTARQVELGANGKPIPNSQSGLFCALNAGTTIVTISAGGLSSSLPVTVQSGSVRQPCGTTKAEKHASAQSKAPPLEPESGPTSSPSGTAPLLQLPLPAPPSAPVTKPAALVKPFFVPAPLVAFIPAFVPPPLPTPARPTPPSGTSAVTSPVEAPQKEEEEEAAPESVSNEAVAYRQVEHEPSPAWIVGLTVLAAFAGASVTRRVRRGRREIHVAPATISAMRHQGRIERDPRRR